MAGEQEFCQKCSRQTECRQGYKRPADNRGRSVAVDACLGLLVPLVVFIVSLALGEMALAGRIADGRLRGITSLALAAGATYISIVAVRMAAAKFLKKH